MPRPKKLKTKQSKLQNINELDAISIYNTLLQGQFKDSDLIEKLEDQNSMYNFLVFYLEMTGLERIVENIKGHNIEEIKLDQELSKLEKLQQQNDDCLINEEACKNITEKNKQFLENIHSFYSILFSTQTNLPFEINDFFKCTFNWLNSITQSRFRLIRISGLEIIAIIMEELIKFLSENDDIYKEKECVKFLQNLIEYLINFRARDVLPQIRRRVCQIVFLPFGIQQFNFDVYYGQIGDLFMSINHECREQALIELEKYQFETIHSFMSSEQESVISLLFDQNESIQIKLIHFISQFITQYKQFDQSFFNKSSKQAFIRQLFCQNTRVKYEVARIIQYFEPKISTSDKSPTVQLENLIKFFLENVPDEQIGFNECFSFVFSFLPHHQYLMNPQNYMQILLSGEENELSRICMLFYAGILEFSQNIQLNIKNLWWIDINDEQQEIVISLRQNFSNCFLERMASINFANNEFPQVVFAYLQVYLKLDFKLFDTILFQPKLKILFEQISRTLQKQSNEEIIYCIGELILKCRNELSNNVLLQEFQIEMSKYIQDLLEIVPINQTTICKVESFIKYNLIRWDKLLTPKLLKSFQEISPKKESNILLAIIKLYGSSLQSTLRLLISNYKSINDDQEGLYKEIRGIFYHNAFKILEEVQISDLQYHVLQLVLQNLTYTNGQKMVKLGFSQKITAEQLTLLCSLINQLIVTDLLKQKQSSDKQDSSKGSAMKLDDLPQLNKFQMQLLHIVVTLLTQSQVILITPQFGIPLLCQFIQISMNNQFFKEYTLILVKLGESISKLMEQDLIYKRQDFWQFINDFISLLHINSKWDNDEHCNEFAKLIISALLVHTNKANVKEIRERFIGFCAESIEKAFSSIEFSPFLTLLTQIFYKPTKLIKALQIDKLTYKKFSAFYEMTSKQFHSQEHAKEYKALIEKKEGPLKARLRQQTGLSNMDMEKILKDKKQSVMESDKKMDEDVQEALKKQQKK